MADRKITELTSLASGSVDRSTDVLEIADVSESQSKKITPFALMGISSAAVGTTDTQTLTNKTITAPAVSDPVLSGTITGIYTLGGTPTFPSTVVSTTGVQTLTNKTLTSPTINTATIVNPTLTVDTVNEHTSANGVTIDGLNIKDSKLNTNNSVVTANITDAAVTSAKAATGFCVQQVSSLTSAVATGTTIIPLDDTIPQITEGTEFMTCAITPKSSTNTLEIVVTVFASCSSGASNVIGALFQDATASALASNQNYNSTATAPAPFSIVHTMAAGTTSPITFRVRLGGSGASTITFNGQSGARLFGATTKSSIVIREYKA